ncbi:MAG: hypothetical protein CME69_04220 [Halobacteriovorax sp.]|nr:hypothetical protein [Halobacteriovorax sp.]
MKLLFLLFFLGSCSSTMFGDLSKYKPVGKKRAKTAFSPLWIKNLDNVHDTGNQPIALASPLVHEDTVYAGSKNYFNAYDVKSGRLLWREKTKGVMHSGATISGSILFWGDISGRLYAKDLEKDEMKYMLDVGAPIDATPVVENGRLYLHTRNHKIFCLDQSTGKILWSYKRSVPYFSTLQRTSRPKVIGNRVYVGFADGYLVSFSVEEGQVIWEKKLSVSTKFVDVDMSPTYFNGKLLVGSIDGNLEILDPQNGVLFKRYTFVTNRKGEVFGDSILFGDIEGNIIEIDKNFNMTRTVKVSKDQISNVKKWKGGVVVTTVSQDVIYLDKDLAVVSRLDLGSGYSAVFGEVSVQDDHLALYSSRNRVYLFK